MNARSTGESATGGSAATQAVDVDASRWRTRRWVALAIRMLVLLLPFGGSLIVARGLALGLPAPSGVRTTTLWWASVIIASTVALLAVDKMAKRLLPIAMLFRLALVFPDRAPSRYRVALRTGTARQLTERLRSGGDLGDTPAEAAQNLLALVASLGKHDRLTRGHSERVRAYTDVIAREMGLTDDDRERLHWAALVHDVGKMHVRPEVLNKPGRPTDDEWDELRRHPAAAAALVAPLRPWLGDWLDAATQHHERVDGGGYPHGLRGDEISLSGRIVAVADAYDCMTSARSYKKPLPAEQARYELARNSGTQFDPDVVRALLGVSVGRLHLAAGPLAWLAQLPGVREGVAVSTAGGASVSGAAAAALVTAVGAVGGFVAPVDATEQISAPRRADAIEVVGAPVDATAEGTGTARPASRTSSKSGSVGSTGPDAASGAPVAVRASEAGPTSTSTVAAPVAQVTATTMPGPVPTAPRTVSPTTTTTPAATTSTTTPVATTTTVPNQPPVANDDFGSMKLLLASAKTFDVLANDHDSDGTLATLAYVSGFPGTTVVNGRLQVPGGLVSLTPWYVVYRVCDDDGACAEALLTITVTL